MKALGVLLIICVAGARASNHLPDVNKAREGKAPLDVVKMKNQTHQNYYSKEWQNIHSKRGYVAYDENVYTCFWILMGALTVLATIHFCYRRKYPKRYGIPYNRFDMLQTKREQCKGDIIKDAGRTPIFLPQQALPPKNKQEEEKFFAICLENIIDGKSHI